MKKHKVEVWTIYKLGLGETIGGEGLWENAAWVVYVGGDVMGSDEFMYCPLDQLTEKSFSLDGGQGVKVERMA